MTGVARPLTGELGLIVAQGLPVMAGVAEGLGDAGADVRVLDDPRLSGAQDQVREALTQALDGRVPALVLVSLLADAAGGRRPLTEQTLDDWRAQAIEPIRTAMRVLVALGEVMKPAGRGSIVLLAPSLSLVGGDGRVALGTALEGQRGLVKSVARQWGGTGVTVNWIAAAPVALSDRFDAASLAAKGDAVPVALGRRPDARAEIASLAAWMAGPGGRGMTGATLMLDGGEWMVP
ncbi:SDR family oxidoreductase [Brevundimonas sp.]|uniref:SDR family oxidoreductase n=1 Tax=Brevundimonas sp. TaxID=1871086 RepID=UPI002AB8D55F|nr:SDR family oxidoreductase [Brevundimonas sp.]MDZ4363298.1 SDR family oxidoreductase [Brevundimonas sp.]